MNPVLEWSLKYLEASELVRGVPESESTYQFKHALVQDTAHASLLLQERKRLHRLVAECLEAAYADRLDEIAVRLYQHYDAAGQARKTIEHAERAGDAASRKSAYAEAIVAYTRALALVEQQPDETERQIRLVTRLGRTYEEVFNYETALALYQRTREQAESAGNRPLELVALVQIAKVYAVAAMRYDPEQSERVAQEALDLARVLGDRHAEARVYWIMMLASMYGGKGSREGRVHGERSLELARALDWHEQMAYSLNDLVYIYMNIGDSKRAFASAAEARTLWRELDNKPMWTDNLNSSAMQHRLTGEFETALTLATESHTLSTRIGNRWNEASSFMVEGYSAERQGQLASALSAFQACLQAADPIGMQGLTVMARLEPAWMHAFLGNTDQALAYAQDALTRVQEQRVDWDEWGLAVYAYAAEQSADWQTANATVEKIKDEPPDYYFDRMPPFGAVEIVYAQIRYELRRNQIESALTRVEQLLERVRDSDHKIFIPVAQEYLARVYLAQNELDRARQALAQGKTLASTLGLLPAQLGLQYLEIELETARHNMAGRETALREASALIRQLLVNIPPELHSSFRGTGLGKILQNARDTASSP